MRAFLNKSTKNCKFSSNFQIINPNRVANWNFNRPNLIQIDQTRRGKGTRAQLRNRTRLLMHHHRHLRDDDLSVTCEKCNLDCGTRCEILVRLGGPVFTYFSICTRFVHARQSLVLDFIMCVYVKLSVMLVGYGVWWKWVGSAVSAYGGY